MTAAKRFAWWSRRFSSASDDDTPSSHPKVGPARPPLFCSGYPEAVSEGGRVGRVPRPSIAVVETRRGHPLVNPVCPGSW